MSAPAGKSMVTTRPAAWLRTRPRWDAAGQAVLEYVLLLSAFVTLFLLIHRWALTFVRQWFEAMVAVIAGPGV